MQEVGMTMQHKDHVPLPPMISILIHGSAIYASSTWENDWRIRSLLITYNESKLGKRLHITMILMMWLYNWSLKIRVVFKSGRTLHSMLTKVKDTLPLVKQSNVVYNIPCSCGQSILETRQRWVQNWRSVPTIYVVSTRMYQRTFPSTHAGANWSSMIDTS